MALFGRMSGAAGPPRRSGLQIPDQLAEQADWQYGTQQFEKAFEIYAEAIDKIHSMCVVAPWSSRIRTPGRGDELILDGLQNSLGAAVTINPEFDPKALVERTVAYLMQIASEAGPEGGRYARSAAELESIMRRR